MELFFIFDLSSSAASLRSIPNDLDENSLFSSAIEFAIKDLFPWAKIQLPAANSHHDFSSHDLPP